MCAVALPFVHFRRRDHNSLTHNPPLFLHNQAAPTDTEEAEDDSAAPKIRYDADGWQIVPEEASSGRPPGAEAEEAAFWGRSDAASSSAQPRAASPRQLWAAASGVPAAGAQPPPSPWGGWGGGDEGRAQELRATPEAASTSSAPLPWLTQPAAPQAPPGQPPQPAASATVPLFLQAFMGASGAPAQPVAQQPSALPPWLSASAATAQPPSAPAPWEVPAAAASEVRFLLIAHLASHGLSVKVIRESHAPPLCVCYSARHRFWPTQ